MNYNELYELLRKEKYSDRLQPLAKLFVSEVSAFLKEQRAFLASTHDSFSDDALKRKKQFENTLSIFKEFMRIRKHKILNLVFVASETGIVKRDFSTMLQFEQDLFERLVAGVEEADKLLNELLNGDKEKKQDHKLVFITQPLGEFVDMFGKVIGPFEKGTLVNLDSQIADILVADSKAAFVDELSEGAGAMST